MEMGVLEEAYVDEVCVVYVAPDLYLLFYLKEKWRKMLIPCLVIYGLQLPRKHVSHNIIYFYN